MFEQSIRPNTLNDGDKFGYKVSLDGDYCAIGAPFHANPNTNSTGNQAGAAYVFTYGGTWLQQSILMGVTDNSNLGWSLCLRGTTLVVGSPSTSSNADSTATVGTFKRSGTTWSFSENIRLRTTQGFDVSSYFGLSVMLDGDRLYLSIPGNYVDRLGGGTNTSGRNGFVAVYRLGAGGTYYLSKMINDNEPILPDSTTVFGNSVGASNGYYIIGIPKKAIAGMRTGAVAFGYIE